MLSVIYCQTFSPVTMSSNFLSVADRIHFILKASLFLLTHHNDAHRKLICDLAMFFSINKYVSEILQKVAHLNGIASVIT